MKQNIIDVCGIAGGGLITYGAWLIYEPVGFIVGGGIMMGLAVLASKSAANNDI